MKTMVCVRCHHVGKPKKKSRGSILIEIVLWICFIVPGLIYSLWRMTSRFAVCRECGATELVPEGSPRAQAILKG